jgi:hypothetical protein
VVFVAKSSRLEGIQMSILSALGALASGLQQGQEMATDHAWKQAEIQHLQQINQANQRNANDVPLPPAYTYDVPMPPAHTRAFMDAVRRYAQTGDPRIFAGIPRAQLQAGQHIIQSAHDHYVQAHHQQHAQFIQSFTGTPSVPMQTNIPPAQNANALRANVPMPTGNPYVSLAPPSLPPASSNPQYLPPPMPAVAQRNPPVPRPWST